MDKKILSLENFLKLATIVGLFYAFAYDIKGDLREVIINATADNKINDSRFVILEKAKDNHEGRLGDIEQRQYIFDAILTGETKIKGK